MSDLLYVIADLTYNLMSDARREAFKQQMAADGGAATGEKPNPYDPRQMVKHLRNRPAEAAELTWTLDLELTPIYAIEPVGEHRHEVYAQLVNILEGQILAEQLREERREQRERDERARLEQESSTDTFASVAKGLSSVAQEALKVPAKVVDALLGEPKAGSGHAIERVTVAGTLAHEQTKLFSGQQVPVVRIRTTRGLFGWPARSDEPIDAGGSTSATTPREFVQLIRKQALNLGVADRDRALNAAVTHIVLEKMDLDAVEANEREPRVAAERSQSAPPDSDCWDGTLHTQQQNGSTEKVVRFAIGVSDAYPVRNGETRTQTGQHSQ